MDAFNPLLIVMIPVTACAIQGLLGYWIGRKRAGRNGLALLGGATLVSGFLWFAAATGIGYVYAFCCFGVESWPIEELYAQELFYSGVTWPFTFNGCLIGVLTLAGLYLLGLLAFSLSRLPNFAALLVAGLAAVAVVTGLIQFARSVPELAYRTIVPDAEVIPLYPRSKVIWEGPRYPQRPHRLYITTESTAARDVIAFYKEELPRYGWVDVEQDAGSRGLHFVREFVEQGLAWKYELNATSAGSDAAPSLWLSVVRWPDLDKLPVYPGGQEIEVKPPQGERNSRQHSTAYVTGASPDEVRAFYRTLVHGNGWSDVETGSDSTKGLHFVNYAAYPVGTKVADLTVVTASQPDGRTRVELFATGYDIP